MEVEPDDEHGDESLQYRGRQDIAQHELVDGLSSLRLLGDEERTPMETTFLSAQSQMWIFAAYEILRTWRQRAREVLRLDKSGGLTARLAELKKDEGFQHVGREIRADQIQGILDDPGAIAKIEEISELPIFRLPI